MSVIIRKMEEKDIEPVSSIDNICFPTVKPPINYKGEFENEKAHYWICEQDSKVIGFAGFWFFAEQADIISVCVLPEYRNMHIASRLLIALIEECLELGSHWINLEVRVSNLPAQALYKKFGFIEDGIRKGYYLDNREDAILMGIPSPQENDYKQHLLEIKNSLK